MTVKEEALMFLKSYTFDPTSGKTLYEKAKAEGTFGFLPAPE